MASVAPRSRSDQGAAAPNSGGAGPGLSPEWPRARCARIFRSVGNITSVLRPGPPRPRWHSGGSMWRPFSRYPRGRVFGPPRAAEGAGSRNLDGARFTKMSVVSACAARVSLSFHDRVRAGHSSTKTSVRTLSRAFNPRHQRVKRYRNWTETVTEPSRLAGVARILCTSCDGRCIAWRISHGVPPFTPVSRVAGWSHRDLDDSSN